ncbi:SH3 domain-containing kinase-binding protein 1-like, partial [Ictidomys tridecemlineatus]
MAQDLLWPQTDTSWGSVLAHISFYDLNGSRSTGLAVRTIEAGMSQIVRHPVGHVQEGGIYPKKWGAIEKFDARLRDMTQCCVFAKTIGKKLSPATVTPDPSKTEMDSRTKSKDYCKVIFPYEAQNDDELTIKEGDIVTLINKDCIDVGWWEGELNGRRGVFPDNFVKLLPPDFDKEGNRPKKPPPPSAPVIKQGAGTTERKHELKKIPPERPETLPNRTEEKERPEREPKLDLQKPSVPAIPPKKPRPPKTNSLNRPGALPPRRPERPVGPLTHTRGDGPKIELTGSTLASILDKDLSDRSKDI